MPGRAKGSQGYSAADCITLVEAVKAFLPLGAIEWGFVQDWYNVYATDDNRAPHNLKPLKMKFWVLVNHAKPTGDPNCPAYVCDAKGTQKAMDVWSHVIACNNPQSENEEKLVHFSFVFLWICINIFFFKQWGG